MTGGPNEVWAFGEEAHGHIREVLALRERIRPYVMSQVPPEPLTPKPAWSREPKASGSKTQRFELGATENSSAQPILSSRFGRATAHWTQSWSSTI
jgi:hypothetical protein